MALVSVAQGQYILNAEAAAVAIPPVAADAGFLTTEDSTAVVYTRTEWGTVAITSEILSASPPTNQDDWLAGGWQAVAEASIRSDGSGFVTVSLTESPEPLFIETSAVGWMRLRVMVAQRSQTASEISTEPAEVHHLQLWPEPAWRPGSVLLEGS